MSDMKNSEQAWHEAINAANRGNGFALSYMYDGKALALEIPRLTLLFQLERTGALPGSHQQCSHATAEPVIDNHLTCCLHVACRACPALLALDAAAMTDEQRDTAKAWTCAAHILMTKGLEHAVDTSEGFILTTDDRMFWDRVYMSLSGAFEADEVGDDQ